MQTDIEQTTGTTNIQHDIHGGSSSLTATAPGQLRVIKRNGTVVPFDASKIAIAMTKAFLAVEGGKAAASTRVREMVESLTQQITATFKRRMPSGGTIHIEEIQDQVELILMRSGEQKVARDYVLYREEHARLRAQKQPASQEPDPDYAPLNVVLADGSRAPLNIARMRTIVHEACAGLAGVEEKAILDEAMRNLYDGVAEKDV
ncbi:MAG TPA: ATP cone domain-containing protein, partial [Cellvibrio sp.]|nr:ATP cone domain-containing protein [Cellvibrio sp.]